MKQLLSFILILLYAHSFAADYYWVGGSGNWSNISHWRTSSGGNSTPSVLPGPTDNVYFDSNSGFTAISRAVNLDVDGHAHNITFRSASVAPLFSETNTMTLNIYGSSEWQTGMGTISISKINYHHTGEAKHIQSHGVKMGNDNSAIYFREKNSITLQDDLEVLGNLYLLAGTWNTSNHQVTINKSFFANDDIDSKIINLGNSKLYLPSSIAEFNTNSARTSINSGTSHLYFTNLSSNTTGTVNVYSGQTLHNISFDGGIIGHLESHNGTAHFNQVEFKNNGFILGNNTFKDLLLAPGKTYQLQAGGKQTITNHLTAHTAQCENWSMITSNSVGIRATIEAANHVSIDVTGSVIRDLEALGGANFTTHHSINSGNNSGWTFSPFIVRNLYWVGGSGLWNDRAHWSQTSGGPGGFCIPGPSDHVFFDSRSGFTTTNKTISLYNTSYAHDIKFAGSAVAPTLNQNGVQSINIYGSTEWQSGMPDILISEIHYRQARENRSIKSNGVKMGANNFNVYFEEEESISLLDDLEIQGHLHVLAGTWNTNNHKVTINNNLYANDGTKDRTINMGSSRFFMPSNVPLFNTDSPNTVINSGTSTIYFTGAISTANRGILARSGQAFNNVVFENNAKGYIMSRTGITDYNRVEFKTNGFILGNNRFKNLIYSPDNTYQIQAGTRQIITELFSANTSQCAGWTTIKSDTSGSQATIEANNNATIDVAGVIMSDIKAVGSANFTAHNSINNYNNSGWSFPISTGIDLFWVGGNGNWNDRSHWSQSSGGIGGYCIPGPADNAFIDAGSGFTSNAKTITLDNTAYIHNLIFSGSTVPPSISQITNQTLNIYGSSEWQSGMESINISNIYYMNTGEDKTIKSNSVPIGESTSNIYFSEETSISLLDNLNIKGTLYLLSGIWKTNGHKVTIQETFYANSRAKDKTMDFGNSEIYMTSNEPLFYIDSPTTTLLAGTSQLFFNGNVSLTNRGIIAHAGQTFNHVVFERNAHGYISALSGVVNFKSVEFKNNGVINGSNDFKNLMFSGGKTYKLASNKTQTIENWTIGGTPCAVTSILSSISGTHTNIDVTGTTTDFNFANIKDMNAIGQTLHFGEQSTVENQNNANILFDPYNPGSFTGFGPHRTCYTIDPTDPESYLLSTKNFYGNAYTTYEWYKTGGSNSSTTQIISTSPDIDLRTFGYGRYKVIVDYNNSSETTCTITEETIIDHHNCGTTPMINPNLRIRVL